MNEFFDKLFGRSERRPRTENKEATVARSKTVLPYQTGEIIAGKFEVRGVLGQGGFGIVYHVRFLETGEDLALKTFKEGLTATPAAEEAFRKEALVWVNLERHPFILPAIWVDGIRHGRVIDVAGDTPVLEHTPLRLSGRLFVVMQYVQGDAQGRANLQDYLRGSPLDERQILKWAIQFCLGMEHANNHGIECHRDIKPSNIMVIADGTLKITDFGLAIATESAWRNTVDRHSILPASDRESAFRVCHTEIGAVCGTPGYIAPEVYEGCAATVASDIYSFGVVFWQMAAGSANLPFGVPYFGDIGEYMRRIYERQISTQLPQIDGPMGKVVTRCLQLRPTHRYTSFEELRSALEPFFERRAGHKFQIPQLGGQSVASLNNKGASLAALGRYGNAIECYDTALRIDSRSYKTWNNKGSALSALGRRDEAIACFHRSLEIEPNFAMARRNMSREHLLKSFDGEQ
jgi:eukaryotic-like serine/threonine-protein kinase